jgi:hypothetical protein
MDERIRRPRVPFFFSVFSDAWESFGSVSFNRSPPLLGIGAM